MANKNFKSDITADGDISGKYLKATNSNGDEGGEILLSKPATNSTIAGTGVTVDVYQNKLRFFENGGDARGYYLDITGGGNGAATNIIGGGSASDSFKTIAVTGQSNVVADSSTDTLNLVAGTNVSITTDAASDSITINSAGTYTSVDSITYPDYITFDTTPETIPTASGSLYWDSGDGVLESVLNANVSIGLGQEQVALIKNTTGSSIAKGKVVYISGAQGQRPTITLSDADTETTSSKTFGVTAETIADGAEGYITTFGVLRGVNTDGLTEGGAIWLSQTAGDFTQTIPAEPAHAVFIGYVVKAHASSGEIFINIQNGYELTELHGVLIENGGSLADNEVLAYDTTSGLWKNQTSVEAGLIDTSATAQTKAGDLTVSTKIITPRIENTADINIVSDAGSGSTNNVQISTRYNNIDISDTDSKVIIVAGNNTNSYTYSFGTTGLTFADTTVQSTAFLGISSYSTTNISEGTNLYYTDERAQDAIGNNLGSGLSYNDSTGAVSNSGVLDLIGTANEIVVTGTNAQLQIGIPDSPVFVTPNIGVATATSVNGTTIPSSKTLLITDDISVSVQAYSTTLAGINTLGSGTGFLKNTAGTWSYDNSTYLTTSDASSTYLTQSNASSTYLTQSNASSTYLTQSNAATTYQPLDQDLTDIAALTANGFLKKTGGVWSMDTSTYLTSYTETDTLSSVTGRGATTSDAISITNATASSSYTTGALVVTGGVGIGEDLYVDNDVYIGGNINITGSITGDLTSVDVTNLVVTDPLIYLAEGNPNDSVDIGIFAALNHGGPSYSHTGLIRDASDSGKWKLVSGLADPTANVINFTGATFDTLKLGTLEATSVPTVGTITSGTWNGTVIGYAYGGTGLTTLGTAGQVLKVNSGATGLEWGTVSGGSSFTNSSELAALLSDETGTGLVVFNNSPSLTSPTISGGTINNAPIGATTASTGKFTSVDVDGLVLIDTFTGTTSATSSFDTTVYSSAEFIVYGSTSTGKYVSKVLMLANGSSTPVITEYAILTQGTAPTVTITPSYSAPNAVLTVAVTSGTSIKIVATEVAI